MDPPSSSGSRSPPTQPRAGAIPQMAFCHECGIEIRPLMTPDPTCPRCNGQFVEVIEQGTAAHPADFFDQVDDDDDDDDDAPFATAHTHPYPGFRFHTAPIAGRPQFVAAQGSHLGGLGGLLMALASGAAQTQPASNRGPQSPSASSAPSDPHASSLAQESRTPLSAQGTTRSGSSSFGPFGVQWNVQYGSGGGDPYQRAAQQQSQQEVRTPPTLSNFLRFAFGPETPAERAQPDEAHAHDDGMGGAGGAADGRNFNHDNRATYHQPPQSPDTASASATTADAAPNELPPELAALRNLFTGLFGEPGVQGGGSLLDVLAAGAQGGGPRGQWGDYVLGQQGLDDIISQLMEQTQGSNAPPPASDDVIARLERFTRSDEERVGKAKNQDCPTCKDEFLHTEPGDEQQEELVAMPCKHLFHEDCLVPWLRLHGTCPVCRVSIAPTRDEHERSAQPSTTAEPSGPAATGTEAEGAEGAAREEEAVRGAQAGGGAGWPSPPNPFSAFFHTLSGGGGVARGEARVSRDSQGTTTTTFQTQPPASTTITSTVYPSPPPTAGGAPTAVQSRGDVQVNAIVSSPPLVSDRDDFFSPTASPAHEVGADERRETLRRAAEARAERQRFQLEPDELD